MPARQKKKRVPVTKKLMGRRSKSSGQPLRIVVVNLGDVGLKLRSAAEAAERLLMSKAVFEFGDAAPLRKLLLASVGLRAIRDTGIVGAAELRQDERELVAAAVHDGKGASRPMIEARSLQSMLWRQSGTSALVVIHPLLMVTWHRFDLRYHARTLLAGYPTLISLPGLIEAPAKPKEYYILISRGAKKNELDEQFRGRFLDKDSDLSPYLTTYLAAVGAYYLLGEPFCDFPGCALYDNHWQKELLESPGRKLCKKHETKFNQL
ncbi:MAG TPA: DUF6775 family putative metallopeptidase [Thermoplasmata archaeon]|nr:DUF6775 family putative metallopeptidase [Thermoplasmata archaeon]